MSTQEPCPRIEALSALTDDELHEPQRLDLEAHVAGCAICAPALVRLRQLRTQFAALPSVAPEFDVAAEVDRRIGAAAAQAAKPVAPRPARPRWWQVALLAPAGVGAVTIGLWLGAALMPAALGPVRTSAMQMAAFSSLPPGALCPVANACGGPTR